MTGTIPYDYQARLAGGDSGTACRSQVIAVPTGLGKTAAVVIAWLWNRWGRTAPSSTTPRSEYPAWPRRLVYVLPMRSLVEQTTRNIEAWRNRLGLSRSDLGVHVLMGGESGSDWDLRPESPAILVGTQDMLLSRALNRGYGMSRYRWPMHFALLNSDCLWVFDETQLMGVGMETSAQLDGFRSIWPTSRACPTWWMSATLDPDRLETIDHPRPETGWLRIELTSEERASGRPADLLRARKPVRESSLKLEPSTKASYPKQIAAEVVRCHRPGTLTLVVVNRVARARAIYEALTAKRATLYDPTRVALVHSRFRPKDRQEHESLLLDPSPATGTDRIVVATQAVEAGVDVSARLLVTELAPWTSLVQRFGRCNRRADFDDAEVVWIDVRPKDDSDELCLPYSHASLEAARAALGELDEASPARLATVEVPEEAVVRPVIRRREFLDLFDTTPDVCGQDLDVSRYIRDGEDSDVQFFWRDLPSAPPPSDTPSPDRDELCRVSISDARKFFKSLAKRSEMAWRWDSLQRAWVKAEHPIPGGIYLLSAQAGGYSDELGWTGESKDKPTPTISSASEPEDHDSDASSQRRDWQSLEAHSLQVIAETTDLCRNLDVDPRWRETLTTAARWHDVGKALPEFQAMLRDGDASREGTFWAKSPGRRLRSDRPHYRHELAAALAWLLTSSPLAPGNPGSAERDGVAYLIAAHHGKVRLSIRSLPAETGDPKAPEKLFARGVYDGDILPPVRIGDADLPEVRLDLGFMQMGEGPYGPSWLARCLALRDALGPFALAYLETLLRVADARASMDARLANSPTPLSHG